jgi:heme exporter protein D
VTLGPHAAFIVVAYAASLLVVIALVIWVVADYRTQRRALAELEASSPDKFPAKGRA